MEVLLELAITLSLSFIFTFLLAKLVFPDHSSLSFSDDDHEYIEDLMKDGNSKLRDDPIKKLMIDELYFDSKHRNDKFGFREEVIEVHRVSTIEERDESAEFLCSKLSEEIGGGGVRDVVVVDDEEEDKRSGGDGGSIDGVVERAMICGIEIELINAADRSVDRVTDYICDCDRGVQFDDDWEAIERDDFEEIYSNQGVLVDDDENSKIDDFVLSKNSEV